MVSLTLRRVFPWTAGTHPSSLPGTSRPAGQERLFSLAFSPGLPKPGEFNRELGHQDRG